MVGESTFTVHLSLTVSPKSVYLEFAERLLAYQKNGHSIRPLISMLKAADL